VKVVKKRGFPLNPKGDAGLTAMNGNS
jgi:hypothetical protein